MASGEFISARQSDFYVRAQWEATALPSQNASHVTVQVYVGYYSIQIGSRTVTASIGQGTQSAQVPGITHYGSHDETLAATFTGTVSHSADGTGSAGIEASFPFNITTSSGSYIGTLTASGTAHFDPIARPGYTVTLTPVDTPLSGVYVQGHSRVQVTVTADSPGTATIEKVESEIGGEVFSGVSPVLNRSGDVTVRTQITDSRGLTVTVESSLFVQAYTPPAVTVLTCERRTAGAYDPAGSELYLRCTVRSMEMGGEVLLSYSCNGSPWTALNITQAASGFLLPVTLVPERTYTLRLQASDDLARGSVVTAKIPTAYAEFHLRQGGGAAFGKYAEQSRCLDIAENWAFQARGSAAALGGEVTGAGFHCHLPADFHGMTVTGLADPQADTDGVNLRSVFSLVYPVGSIYWAAAPTDPARLFGGVWEEMASEENTYRYRRTG